MNTQTVMQALGVDLCTPRNEREEAHHKACEELAECFQQFISGILMVHEYTNAVAAIGAKLPALQVGDIEPITGLSMKPTVPSETTRAIHDALSAHIDSHQLLGHEWPADAQFAIVYRYSTWPVGWEKELDGRIVRHVAFFSTREELDTWIAQKRDWSRLEDNYVAYQAYAWDLGPQALQGVCSNEGHLH